MFERMQGTPTSPGILAVHHPKVRLGWWGLCALDDEDDLDEDDFFDDEDEDEDDLFDDDEDEDLDNDDEDDFFDEDEDDFD